MAKKRFTAGMDSLFDNPQDQHGLESEAVLSPKPKTEKKSPSKARKKSDGKGFRDDLKAFLQEAFEESFEQQLEQKNLKALQLPQNQENLKVVWMLFFGLQLSLLKLSYIINRYYV